MHVFLLFVAVYDSQVLAVVSLIIGTIVNLFNFIVNCIVIVGCIAGMLGAWRRNMFFLFIVRDAAALALLYFPKVSFLFVLYSAWSYSLYLRLFTLSYSSLTWQAAIGAIWPLPSSSLSSKYVSCSKEAGIFLPSI